MHHDSLIAAGELFAITLNRDDAGKSFKLPADGWFQIAKTGVHTKTLDLPDGKKARIRQVVTAADFASIANRYKGAPEELLVDFDHFSADPGKSTIAGAWIGDVEARGDGLWAKLRLSSRGETALTGGDYRHFSPVFGFPARDYKAGEEAHPVALLGGALTNQPTFKGMLPLSNRPDAGESSETTTHMDYKAKLIALTGAPADADDTALEAACAKTQNHIKDGKELPTVKNRLDVLLAEQVEHDLDARKLTGDVREKWKGALTKNREEALPLLDSLHPVSGDEDYARTHNRQGAKTPKDGEAGKAKAEERAAKVASRAAQLRAADPKLSVAVSYNRAEAEIPA